MVESTWLTMAILQSPSHFLVLKHSSWSERPEKNNCLTSLVTYFSWFRCAGQRELYKNHWNQLKMSYGVRFKRIAMPVVNGISTENKHAVIRLPSAYSNTMTTITQAVSIDCVRKTVLYPEIDFSWEICNRPLSLYFSCLLSGTTETFCCVQTSG